MYNVHTLWYKLVPPFFSHRLKENWKGGTYNDQMIKLFKISTYPKKTFLILAILTIYLILYLTMYIVYCLIKRYVFFAKIQNLNWIEKFKVFIWMKL